MKKPGAIVVAALLALSMAIFSSCGDKEKYEGADGIPSLAFMRSLLAGGYDDKLVAEGYSFVGYYDDAGNVPGYAKMLDENWQAIVTIDGSSTPTAMFYDKQLAAEPYPYVDAAKRFRTIFAEERTMVPDSSVTQFNATIVDNPGDSASATRRFTSREDFHRAIERYFASADSVKSHQKGIKLALTSAKLALTIEYNTPLTNSTRQSSIAVSRLTQ